MVERGHGSERALAYVTCSYADTVAVIDVTTNEVLASVGFDDAPPKPTWTSDHSRQVDVAHGPVNPTVSPDGRHVYVARSVGGGVAVIDTGTQTVSRVIDPGGPKPSGLAFTPDGERLVVTLLGQSVDEPGSVAVVDCATGEAGTPIPVGGQPERLALSPDGRRAHVVSMHDRSMWVLEVDTGAVVARVGLDELPFNVLVSSDGTRVYVGNLRADSIAVIDTASYDVVGTVDVPSPNGLAFGPDHRTIYVTSVFDDSVQVVDLDAGNVVRSAGVGEKPGHLALTRDGARAYVVRPFGETVSVIDTETLAVVETIAVDQGPTTVALHYPETRKDAR